MKWEKQKLGSLFRSGKLFVIVAPTGAELIVYGKEKILPLEKGWQSIYRTEVVNGFRGMARVT